MKYLMGLFSKLSPSVQLGSFTTNPYCQEHLTKPERPIKYTILFKTLISVSCRFSSLSYARRGMSSKNINGGLRLSDTHSSPTTLR